MGGNNKKRWEVFKSPILWVCVVGAIVLILGFLGFRIIYAPELPINWTSVAAVATSISAVLTLIAVISAFKANKGAKDSLIAAFEANEISRAHLNEMIYQRKQSERPSVVVGMVHKRKKMYFIISNEGKLNASCLKLRFNDAFINSLNDWRKTHMKKFNESTIHLAPNQKYSIAFARFGDDVIKSNNPVNITVSYMDFNGQHYSDNITFDLTNYHWILESDADYPLDKIANSLKSIQDSMFNTLIRTLDSGNKRIVDSIKRNRRFRGKR